MIRRRLHEETLIQYNIVAALRVLQARWPPPPVPPLVFWHTRNEGKRTDAQRSHDWRMGLLPGVADLTIATPPPAFPGRYRGCWLELKAPKGRARKAQLELRAQMDALLWATAMTPDEDSAFGQLWTWGFPVPDYRGRVL